MVVGFCVIGCVCLMSVCVVWSVLSSFCISCGSEYGIFVVGLLGVHISMLFGS